MSRTLRRVIFGLSLSAVAIYAQAPADNSRANKADQNTSAVTAEHQKESKADRELAQKIRQAVVKDKTLSIYAHNVKIIVQEGTVTLRGPVRSDEEKASVAAKAAEIAGAGNVRNEITIAPKKS